MKQYEDRWGALVGLDKTVVGSGADASAAMSDAASYGYKDVILLRVLPLDAKYVPHA